MKTCKSYERDGKGDGAGTASLEWLLQRHEDHARQFAYSLAGNSDEAKELVQQASCRALKHWKRYDPLKSFQSWYLTIVRNLFLDGRLAQNRAVSLDAPVRDDERGLLGVLADGGIGVLEQLERQELAQAVRESLAALDTKYRAVVRLCDLERMPYVEAADKLGIPLGTLRSRLSRARAAMRRDPRLRRLA